MLRNSFKDKENISEVRQSLKLSQTAKKKTQRGEARMSMLPLKRERTSMQIQPQLPEPRTSVLRSNINLLNTISSTQQTINKNNMSSQSQYYSSQQRSIRKQTIINNLVNKLDEEQEIRSIIQTKLRRNSYGPNKEVMYTSEFMPFGHRDSERQTLIDETNDPVLLNSKLKQCQEELACFRKIVEDMAKKMKMLEKQKQNQSCKEQNRGNFQLTNRKKSMPQNYQDQENIHEEKCLKCCKCKQQDNKAFKKGKMTSTGVQTEDQEGSKVWRVQQTDNYEFDFFDNLDKTLKLLSNSKNL